MTRTKHSGSSMTLRWLDMCYRAGKLSARFQYLGGGANGRLLAFRVA